MTGSSKISELPLHWWHWPLGTWRFYKLRASHLFPPLKKNWYQLVEERLIMPYRPFELYGLLSQCHLACSMYFCKLNFLSEDFVNLSTRYLVIPDDARSFILHYIKLFDLWLLVMLLVIPLRLSSDNFFYQCSFIFVSLLLESIFLSPSHSLWSNHFLLVSHLFVCISLDLSNVYVKVVQEYM